MAFLSREGSVVWIWVSPLHSSDRVVTLVSQSHPTLDVEHLSPYLGVLARPDASMDSLNSFSQPVLIAKILDQIQHQVPSLILLSLKARDTTGSACQAVRNSLPRARVPEAIHQAHHTGSR